jgi:hypothetical protein
MNKTRLTAAAATIAGTIGLMAPVAGAHHEHTLHLPHGGQRQMPCEPAHLATTVHPIHYGFHLALDAGRRGDDRGPGWSAHHETHPGGITVTTSPGACPTSD